VLLLLAGCALERGDAGGGAGSGIDSARQWECDQNDMTLVCQAAIAAADDDPNAYTCEANSASVSCPPAFALAELEEDLESMGLGDEIAATPWACLRTGAVERHCMKDLAAAAPGDPPDDTPDEPSDSRPDDPDPDDDSTTPDPEIPSDCAPESWEPYFCALATASYRNHGVDIEFPCDIFDANAGFDSTLDDVPVGEGDPSLPSCHDGEWAMRDQSWLDAVSHGCFDLHDPILTMCQQGANYAPNSGACAATGTW
jgi:hypothetical protein